MAKKLSPVQIGVLKALQEGGNLRVWNQDVPPFGRHCELRSRNDKVVRKIHMPTFELLQSKKKQGMLLEIKSKREDGTIYVISKRGLEVFENTL